MFKIIVIFSALVFSLSSLEAAYIFKNGTIMDVRDIADRPLQDHFNLGIQALQKKDYKEAVRQFRICVLNFPEADLGQEALYYLGVSYFHEGDMDLANRKLSAYLEKHITSKHFEECFRYKMAIADAFKHGARKHLFGYEKMPQVFSSKDEAIKIYDEVVQALTNHSLAAEALFSKASLLRKEKSYKLAIEAYNTLIKKFPKHDLACKCYLKIAEVYYKQSHSEFHNPDLLQLSELNIKKFKQGFPKDAQGLAAAEKYLQEMQEVYATGLYETGCLYERKDAPKASVLYYQEAIAAFPNTKIAAQCHARLAALQSYADEMH